MDKSKHSFIVKLRYKFDNFMSRGGVTVFFALMFLFLGAIILMAVARFIVNWVYPQKNLTSFFEQIWLAFLQISDGGAIAEDSESNIFNKVVGIITLFLGLILFSSLVAFITAQFEIMLSNLRKGKSKVIENNHTLILGFGDRVYEIINELIIANESQKSPAIVVLAEREKDEMDDFFNETISDRKTTRIVTRSGSTSNVRTLRSVGVSTARSIVILNGATIDEPRGKKDLADARVLKTILAVISCTTEEHLPPILAELHSANKQMLAKNISPAISVIDEHTILAKLMVQTSRIPGLARVYDELVGFAGNEFYFHIPSQGWGGITYGELVFRYPECCVLGIRKKNGSILMNPNQMENIDDSNEAILLAEDDSTIRFSKTVTVPKIAAPKSSEKRPRKIEHHMIAGWSHKAAAIIDEYSQYLLAESGIDLVVSQVDSQMKKAVAKLKNTHPSVKIRLLQAKIDNAGVLRKLTPEKYDTVIIVGSDGGKAEIRDSETISKLLEFRAHFKSLSSENLKTQIITEIADSDNIEIIKEAGVRDFLISNQFVSKIYAQISEEPGVLDIYEDLFSEAGSEVYIKPVSLYFEIIPEVVSFAEVCAAALMRNETAFGVRLMKEERDEEKRFGIYVNPKKSDKFSFSPDDCLITLAEDET